MRDWLKNLLLAVLLAAMAALLTATFFISVRDSSGGRRLLRLEEEVEQSTLEASGPMIYPEVVALVGENGLFSPVDGQSYSLIYQQAEPVYQEALGSAGPLQQIGEREYLEMLCYPTLLVQYHAPAPFYLLQAWGGSELLREELEITGAALAGQGEQVVLLLTDREGGRWQAETAASLSALESLCQWTGESNAVFTQNSRRLPGDQVLTVEQERRIGYAASETELARRGELPQTVQSLFDMNAYLARVYPNSDGSRVYVEGRSTVRLALNGDLVYSGADGADLKLSAAQGPERQAEICQKASDLISRLWEYAGASGQPSLEEVRADGQQLVLRFGLCVNGVFLERTEGDWATVVVREGAVISATAVLRQLEEGESALLLPLRLAQGMLPAGKAVLRVRLLEDETGFSPAICRVTED